MNRPLLLSATQRPITAAPHTHFQRPCCPFDSSSSSRIQRPCQQRHVLTRAHWLRPVSRSPAFNDYISREDKTRRDEIMWQQVSSPDRSEPMSAKTQFVQLMYWIRFQVVPLPIKFLIHTVLESLRGPLFQLHKRYVLACAKLDARISGGATHKATAFRDTAGRDAQFSRVITYQRYHGTRTIADDIKYWWGALAGKKQTGQAAAQPQAT